MKKDERNMAAKEQVIKDLDRVIGLIKTDTKDIPAEEKKQMVAETLDHFDNYVSPGWLKYRKSVSSDSEGGAVLEWQGEGMEEKGIDRATGKVLVEVSPDFYRPTDVVNLWGDPTKAKTELGWNPTKTSFEQLVELMVKHDMEKVAIEVAQDEIKAKLK